MAENIIEVYEHSPSALNFMPRAIRPSHGLPKDGNFPRITVRWTGLRIQPAELQVFRHAAGLLEKDEVPVIYPHVCGFRLQMALLTHPAYPLPIWTALQIRNRLVRHKLFDSREAFDMETQVGGHRLVEKGVEVDLLTRLTRGSDCYWESRITYFHRGRFCAPSPVASGARSPALSDSAIVDCCRTPKSGGWSFGKLTGDHNDIHYSVVDRFPMPKSGGWGFGKLTGDYNGIHYWPWYARRLGFSTAFLHPQRVAGMCMARLREPDAEAQTLALWIKGPVFYGVDVVLNATKSDDGLCFGLSLEGDQRAALIGHWRSGVDGG